MDAYQGSYRGLGNFLGSMINSLGSIDWKFFDFVTNICNLLERLQRFLHTMRTTQGALIVASILNMILGFSTIWGAYAKYASYSTSS